MEDFEMDTLDKISDAPTTVIGTPEDQYLSNVADEAKEAVDTAVDETKEAAQKVNWRKIAGYAAGGLAVVGAIGVYTYWQKQQRKPETRLERLKRQLGMAHVDFKNLRSTIEQFDFDELDRSRRKLGTAAKKATHKGAKKVAELTR
jgi:uncharacterized protein HemX